MYYPRIIIHFDGASKNNPHGPAGCGWSIDWEDFDDSVGGRVAFGNEYLGYGTSNNQAEYEGLFVALDYMAQLNIGCCELYIYGDSELVINHLNGCYRVRNRNLIGLYDDVRNVLGNVNHEFITFSHIARSRNRRADSLAKDAAHGKVYGAIHCHNNY